MSLDSILKSIKEENTVYLGPEINNFSDDDFKQICHAINENKNIRSFNIESKSFISEKQAKMLGDSISNYEGYVNLKINMDRATPDSASIITIAAAENPRLKSIEVSSCINEAAADSIIDNISKSNSIISVDLSYIIPNDNSLYFPTDKNKKIDQVLSNNYSLTEDIRISRSLLPKAQDYLNRNQIYFEQVQTFIQDNFAGDTEPKFDTTDVEMYEKYQKVSKVALRESMIDSALSGYNDKTPEDVIKKAENQAAKDANSIFAKVDQYINANLFALKGVTKSGDLDLENESIRFGKHDIGTMLAGHLNRISRGQSLSTIKTSDIAIDTTKKTHTERLQESKDKNNKEKDIGR